MTILYAVLCGFLLDLLLADPLWMPHPVVYMGKAISRLEKALRRLFPQTPKGELLAGSVLAFLLPAASFGVSFCAIYLVGRLHPGLAFALQVLWCWQCLAAKGLGAESKNVYKKLKTGTLPEARAQVARIVGRDTGELTEKGVIKAAVETVAENFSDGVAAPMLYLLLGGAPLGLFYKAVNTMDSMIGYKNEKYLWFGRAAARLDDLVNYLPARLSAVLLVLAAPLAGESFRGAFRVWRRDRRKHASPNSAQTEAAMAGALGIQLAGPASYFGKKTEKPFIGDPLREPEPQDILRANHMLYTASFLCLGLLGAMRWVILTLL